MLSRTYARLEPANPNSPATTPQVGAPHGLGSLPRSLGHAAELALATAVVLLASSAVWGFSSWMLASWQLN